LKYSSTAFISLIFMQFSTSIQATLLFIHKIFTTYKFPSPIFSF
jgi:hypothetical protein